MDISLKQDSAAPAHGQQVITAVAFIYMVRSERPHVLLAKRADVKKFLPGVFELPGGHIDFGENLKDGLRREIKEEFNTSIRIGSPFGAFTYMNEAKGSHSVEIIYFATLEYGEASIKLDPEVHSEYVWVSLDSITVLTDVNGTDDAELPFIKQGLRLLEGTSIDFASAR